MCVCPISALWLTSGGGFLYLSFLSFLGFLGRNPGSSISFWYILEVFRRKIEDLIELRIHRNRLWTLQEIDECPFVDAFFKFKQTCMLMCKMFIFCAFFFGNSSFFGCFPHLDVNLGDNGNAVVMAPLYRLSYRGSSPQ